MKKKKRTKEERNQILREKVAGLLEDWERYNKELKKINVLDLRQKNQVITYEK